MGMHVNRCGAEADEILERAAEVIAEMKRAEREAKSEAPAAEIEAQVPQVEVAPEVEAAPAVDPAPEVETPAPAAPAKPRNGSAERRERRARRAREKQARKAAQKRARKR
jgi:hypothetical protein